MIVNLLKQKDVINITQEILEETIQGSELWL
jgi:hypothetical protein